MATSPAQLEAIFAGLKTLAEGVFPTTCPQCGAVYEDLKTLIAETAPAMAGSGLREVPEPSAPGVEMLRLCRCGAHLNARFDDRRGRDELGLKRRQLFDHLLGLLAEGGMPRATAKRELLKVMRGETSELLGNEQLIRFFS